MEFQLEGKKIFSIGKLPISDYELRLLVRDQQGRLMSGISKKIDYIIQGNNPTAKQLEKAKASEVPMISYEEFEKMLNQDFLKFDLEEFNGSQDPDILLQGLSLKNWNLFQQLSLRQEKSADLIALLNEHETHHGITKVHHFCSAQLQERYCLDLLHPFHHTGPIRNHDVSPNGKYLATSSDENLEFEDRRAIVQVWDIEKGRPINQFSIRGGVGSMRIDEILNGIQWSPDSQLIGMNKSLNAVAVYQPNGARLSEASITNGIAYAIPFSWANDSQRVAIHWPYYEKLGVSEDEDVEENITWMPAEVVPPKGTNHRESEKHCVPGRESDHPITKKRRVRPQLPPQYKGKIPHEKGNSYYITSSRLIRIRSNSISFFNHDGELLHEYQQYDWNPIGSRIKTQRGNSCSPLFPIDDNRKNFGKLLRDNSLLVPEDFQVERFISASLGRQYSWPLSWIESVPIRSEDTADKW